LEVAEETLMEDNYCGDESFDFEDYRPSCCLDQSRFSD